MSTLSQNAPHPPADQGAAAWRELCRRHKQLQCASCGTKTRVLWNKIKIHRLWQSDSQTWYDSAVFDCKNACGEVFADNTTQAFVQQVKSLMMLLPERQ